MRRLLTCCALLTACRTAPTPAPVAEAASALTPRRLEAPKMRLPEGARPLAYLLDLTVVPGEERFRGEVTIEVELARPLEVLWLNATDLRPEWAQVRAGEHTLEAAPQLASSQFLALQLPRAVGPGPATVRVRYSGVLSKKDTAGLFQLKEGDDAYAFTHFEPLDARRAFPCFDEPQFKVPWQVTLHVKREHLALSNTPALSERDEPSGMKAVTFARTRPLPSYLVAMAAGPFELADGGRWGKNKTPVRVVVPRGKRAEAKWAVEASGPILETLEAYFGSPYPYEKLDEIAFPTNTGAMENPGLVTYGHQLLLSKPEQDTPGRQRAFASVCAHETAHQWFGDLVTMAWWDDLWLNEAFATWMTLKVLAVWQPRWDSDVGQVTRRAGALGSDGLVNARRVRQPIESNDDIDNAFDGITYGKGASVISMFERWVGPEVFQRGVRRYLAEHAHGNATASDFLGALSAEAGRDVATPFATFLDQPGAPRVALTLECAKGAPPRLALAQRRQLPVGSRGDAKQAWSVPVCARWSAGGKEGRACTLLTGETGALVLEGAKSCPDWVLPNDQMLGYYRAALGGATDLVQLLEKGGKKLSVAEKVGVLGDLSALVGSGDLDLGVALRAVPLALQGGNRHLVGQALGLGWAIPEELVPDTLRARHQEFLRGTFGPLARKLGLTVPASDDEDTRLMRPGVLTMVARDGKEPALRQQSLALANAWLADRKAIHPDLVDTVLGIAADTGDAPLHDALLAAAKVEKDRADRNRMLAALSSYRAPGLVKAHLPVVLGSDFETRDAMRLLWGASWHHRTRDTALAFLEANWDALVAKLPKDAGADLVWLAAGACDPQRRDAAKAFFDGRSTKYLGGPRTLAIALEAIDLCIAWRARHKDSALQFLEQWKPGPACPGGSPCR